MATADQYANWLDKNQDKIGTPEFETVKQAYLETRPSSTSEKIEAVGRGTSVGLADIVGAPVDLINNLPRLVNLLPGEQGVGPISDNPIGGSQSIRNTMSNLFDLGYKDISDLPASQRPFAVGGEVVGQSAAIMAPVLNAAKNISAVNAARPVGARPVTAGMIETAPKPNLASEIVGGVVNATARNPAAATAAETALSLGPAYGAGIAEKISPGSPTARMTGELVGSFTPVVLATVLPKLTSSLVMAIDTQLPGGKERRAAELAQKTLVKAGEDPSKQAEALRKVDDKFGGTAGQAINSKALLSIENELIAAGGKISEDIAAQTQRAIDEFNAAYRTAITSGDPDLVRQAAQARQDYLTQTLGKLVDDATKRATNLQSTNLRTADPAKVSASARNILEDALTTARNTENQLWSGVDRTLTLNTNNTLKSYNLIKSELSPGEKLPEPLEALIKSIKKGDKKLGLKKGQTTSGNLLRVRSRYLKLAREARSKKEFSDARHYQKVADAMLDDLDPVVGDAAKVAREFSRELNKKFTQGFVAKTLGVDADGGLSVDPTRTLENAVVSSDQQQLLNLQAMQRAAGDQAGDMAALQQQFFQNLAADTTNFDGTVNPKTLESFISNNRATIDQLGLTDVLTDTAAATRFAERAAAQAKAGTAFATQKSAAANVLRTNNMNEYVQRVLRSNNVSGGFDDAARLAKRSRDPAVMDGLRYSIYETFLDTARTDGGLISGNRLEALLNAKSGNQTLRQTLLKNGTFTSGQMRNIDRLINKTKQFEAALANTSRAEDLLGGEDVFFDLLLRIGGATVGGNSVIGNAAGTPLVAAGAGVRASQKLFDKMPKMRVKSVLAEAINDPKLMATLLEKPTTVKAKAARDKRLYAALLQAGLLDGSELIGNEVE